MYNFLSLGYPFYSLLLQKGTMFSSKQALLFVLLLCNTHWSCASVMAFLTQHHKSVGALVGVVRAIGSSKRMNFFDLISPWLGLYYCHWRGSFLGDTESLFLAEFLVFCMTGHQLALYLKSRVPLLHNEFNWETE
jgi:hypothetical protein